jgi:hypothetical protein
MYTVMIMQILKKNASHYYATLTRGSAMLIGGTELTGVLSLGFVGRGGGGGGFVGGAAAAAAGANYTNI